MADVNSDGLLDIYVCKGGWHETEAQRRNLLFINQGDLTFREKAKEFGLDDPAYSIHSSFFDMDNDNDLDRLDRDELIAEVRRLRAGIRAHRDSSGHDLCWHHPMLWGLLPEPADPEVAVPPWPRFLRGCVRYRESLDRELPDAPVDDREFGS